MPACSVGTDKYDNKNLSLQINRTDYKMNLLDIKEKDRIISGIHDIYGKLYDELGLSRVIAQSCKELTSFKGIANPDSKRGSVSDLLSPLIKPPFLYSSLSK